MILFTDERGETNTVPTNNGKSYEKLSKTYLKENKIVSEYEDRLLPADKDFSIRGIAKYYLSEDGNRLTIESVQTSPAPPSAIAGKGGYKFIFSRTK